VRSTFRSGEAKDHSSGRGGGGEGEFGSWRVLILSLFAAVQLQVSGCLRNKSRTRQGEALLQLAADQLRL
jgi:hypothetical protein